MDVNDRHSQRWCKVPSGVEQTRQEVLLGLHRSFLLAWEMMILLASESMRLCM